MNEENMNTQNRPRRRRRGVYLLPNLFTTGTLFGGFYGALSATNAHYVTAAAAVFVGMLCDFLDGRVARLTHTSSDFGVQYDSLADMVCFGLAPALIIYQWSLQALGEYGEFGKQLAFTAAFFYAAMAALRLARFNVLAASGKATAFFYGLPSPAAAAFVMGFLIVIDATGLKGPDVPIMALIVTIAAGALMVSGGIRYPSFKNLRMGERVPFRYILMMVLVFVAVSLAPIYVASGIFFVYILAGPVLTLLDRRRARRARTGG